MEIAKTSAIKTTFRCNHCSSRLVIIEDKRNNVAFFGCPKCDCYIVIPPWRLKEFKHRSFFNWKAFMEHMYRSYIDARDSVCQ